MNQDFNFFFGENGHKNLCSKEERERLSCYQHSFQNPAGGAIAKVAACTSAKLERFQRNFVPDDVFFRDGLAHFSKTMHTASITMTS